MIDLAAPLGIRAGAPQLPALLDSEPQGLLAVDMPPGGKRRQGVGKMLVRGGRDDDRVDIPAIKQSPVIRKAPWPCPGAFLPPGDLKRTLEPGGIYIAERGNPGIGGSESGAQELSAPVTKTDEAQANLGLRAGSCLLYTSPSPRD